MKLSCFPHPQAAHNHSGEQLVLEPGWEKALEMQQGLPVNILISMCLCVATGFYCKSTRTNSLPVAIEIIRSLCSGNANVLHQINKFYRDILTVNQYEKMLGDSFEGLQGVGTKYKPKS